MHLRVSAWLSNFLYNHNGNRLLSDLKPNGELTLSEYCNH
jgi:hypothetical protein